MKKFFVYTTTDKVEYSKKIEEFLNNREVNIISMSHQKVYHRTESMKVPLSDRRTVHTVIEEYIAYITYERSK